MSFKKYSIKGNAKQIVKNPTPKQLRQKKYDRDRTDRNKEYINAEIDRRGCCEFCGLKRDNKVYQWHHIWDDDPNKKTISKISGRASIKELDAEFKKCVLLCPTCHTTFHMDLCCMFEHKQQHIDGTYFLPRENDIPVPDLEKKVSNTTIMNFL